MFENTRWSNPNYEPSFDYAQRVEAAKLGQPWLNFASQAAPIIGKGIEAYGQRSAVQDVLDRMNQQPTQGYDWNQPLNISGGGGTITEAGNPLVTGYVMPLKTKEYEELKAKYLRDNPLVFGYNEKEPYFTYNFDYGV